MKPILCFSFAALLALAIGCEGTGTADSDLKVEEGNKVVTFNVEGMT